MLKTTLALVLGSFGFLALAAEVTAAPAPSNAPAVSDGVATATPSVALTFGPILLLGEGVRVLEVAGEARLADKVGLAVILGAGKISGDQLLFLPTQTARVFEAGLSGRYYLLGSFRHGMQLGAELEYMHTTGEVLRARGDGLSLGPFVGYKYTAGFGLTLEGQVGYAFKIASRSQEIAGIEIPATDEEKRRPFINLNVGWSF